MKFVHITMQELYGHLVDYFYHDIVKTFPLLVFDIACSCRIDSLSVLPASFGSQDASEILSHCPSVQSALKVTVCHICL